MALIKCHECGNQVSTEAAACPSCGAKPRPAPPAAASSRGVTPTSAAGMVVTAFAVLLAVMWHFSADSDPPPETACKTDLSCWGNKHLASAGVYCKDPIEKLALHSVRWKDTGTFDQKFSRFRWKDQAAGVVTFVGDKAEFQNGFGAYNPVVYECDFDPSTHTVADVRVQEGRLP